MYPQSAPYIGVEYLIATSLHVGTFKLVSSPDQYDVTIIAVNSIIYVFTAIIVTSYWSGDETTFNLYHIAHHRSWNLMHNLWR